MNVLHNTGLPNNAERQYERWLFLRLSALIDRLRVTFPGLHTRIDDVERSISFLNAFGLRSIIDHATPFFWMNVHRCLTAEHGETALASALLNYLVGIAFDAYYPALPDGQEISIYCTDDDSRIPLPKLGAVIGPVRGCVRLRKVGTNRLTVEAACTRIDIALTEIPDRFRFPLLPISNHFSAKLLLASHSSLFETEYIGKVMPSSANMAALSSMIADAIDLIISVDPSLGDRIASSIGWYVPIGTSSLDIHHSFSAANLIGVIFLSEARDEFRLAEAIVHEYHHNELHAYSEIALLTSDTERLFYSPWRPDARPLYGLIHAIFVFTGISDFYKTAEESATLHFYHESFRKRRLEILWQLEVGLAQISDEELAPAGRELISQLRIRADAHRRDLKDLRETPKRLREHLNTWITAHPTLAPHVRVPNAFGRC
jgi:HEXXH motif-containing protein